MALANCINGERKKTVDRIQKTEEERRQETEVRIQNSEYSSLTAKKRRQETAYRNEEKTRRQNKEGQGETTERE